MKLIKPDSVDVKVYKYLNSATVSFKKKKETYIPSISLKGNSYRLCELKSKLMFAKNLHIILDGNNNHVLCITIDSETLFLGEHFESENLIKNTKEAVEENKLSFKILKKEKLSKTDKWNIFYKGRTLSEKDSHYSLDWKSPKKFLLTIFTQVIPSALFKGVFVASFSWTAIFSGIPSLLMVVIPFLMVILTFGYLSTRKNIKKILKVIDENQNKVITKEDQILIEYNAICETNTSYD